jgi:hypothetical protein
VERADLLVADAERDEDPLVAVRGCLRLDTGLEQSRVGVEEVLGLDARVLEHLLRSAARGDRVHRLDQRFEERRLLRELVLDLEVAVALDEDQVKGDECGRADRGQ